VAEPGGGPLLRRTGETPECQSRWGDAALFDMNGNLDEWVDDPKGRFVGGFFSRSTKNGCQAGVTNHPPRYFDYSTGVRCCRAPAPRSAPPPG
jgi:sulfatase modifying factor 1